MFYSILFVNSNNFLYLCGLFVISVRTRTLTETNSASSCMACGGAQLPADTMAKGKGRRKIITIFTIQ